MRLRRGGRAGVAARGAAPAERASVGQAILRQIQPFAGSMPRRVCRLSAQIRDDFGLAFLELEQEGVDVIAYCAGVWVRRAARSISSIRATCS